MKDILRPCCRRAPERVAAGLFVLWREQLRLQTFPKQVPKIPFVADNSPQREIRRLLIFAFQPCEPVVKVKRREGSSATQLLALEYMSRLDPGLIVLR